MDLYWILKKVSATGILVDREQRSTFRSRLLNELEEKRKDLDSLVPPHLCRQKDFPRTPLPFRCEECKGNGLIKKRDQCSACEGTGAKIREDFAGDNRVGRVPRSTDIFPCELPGGRGEYYARNVTDSGKIEWAFRWYFNSKSTHQVRAYIRSKGHPVPKDKKSKKDTTGQRQLELLARRYKDPFYPKVLEIRSISDLLSKYADNQWWEPAEDGRIHPNFSFVPSTGRLSSSRPNIQNPVKRGELGKEFRKQFIASPGMILVGIDFNSIEAVLTGYFAKDKDFIKTAKLSIHAILASHYLKKLGKSNEPISMNWDEDKIITTIRMIKKRFPGEYSKSKSIVYLSLYGGAPAMIFDQNPGVFDSIEECKQLQDMFFSTLAVKIKKWQSDVLDQAHRKCYLENPYGQRHYFWDILNYDGWDYINNEAKYKLGTQAKDCLAFLPQSTAASIYKEVMVKLRPELVDYLRAPIHDELLFELPENEKDELISEIVSAMETPIPELKGLTIGVEAAYGKSWGEMS